MPQDNAAGNISEKNSMIQVSDKSGYKLGGGQAKETDTINKMQVENMLEARRRQVSRQRDIWQHRSL